MQIQPTEKSRSFCALQRLAIFWVVAAISSAAQVMSPTNIFAPVSTPAQSIFGLSLFVLAVTAAIFVVVFSLLAYAS